MGADLKAAAPLLQPGERIDDAANDVEANRPKKDGAKLADMQAMSLAILAIVNGFTGMVVLASELAEKRSGASTNAIKADFDINQSIAVAATMLAYGLLHGALALHYKISREGASSRVGDVAMAAQMAALIGVLVWAGAVRPENIKAPVLLVLMTMGVNMAAAGLITVGSKACSRVCGGLWSTSADSAADADKSKRASDDSGTGPSPGAAQ
ncbi:MAG: hypothetical protein K0U29_08825 [Gammaproteobacteria bacterium]|nr:hypothetical protein [Gammaproteobacteria bacterium]MCH9745016.1 hypothetical protein [Gammaproteobacteria bacterium]